MKKKGKVLVVGLFLLWAAVLSAQPSAWTPYRLDDVRLSEGSRFYEMQEQHRQYLRSLDAERLVNNVMRAGGMATTAENYGGWQHNHGNGFGNYLSGCSMMVAATGDDVLRQRVEWLVDVIESCQRKEGLDGWFHFSRSKGYYNQLMAARGNGCYPQNNGEDFYTNSDMAGMVFYQLHRIFYGLRDAWRYAHVEKARTVFVRCMEWACKWTDLIGSDAAMQMALEAEHGGMAELFFDAYELTGDERFKRVGQRWIRTLNFRDRLARGDDCLTGHHANVYDPQYMGLLRCYELTGDERDGSAARFVWECVAQRHTLPMGGHGRWERYGQPGRHLDELASTSAETCCTNNLLRFSQRLFTLFGETRYMDFYERALYNHILASKDPDNNTTGGGFCYYQSLLPGMSRRYMDDNSFYCCWETGLENHSKYGEAVFLKNADGDVLVNLFIPSVLTDSETGLRLRLEGDYPRENRIRVVIERKGAFTGRLLMRKPAWMHDFDHVFDGPWHDGDVVEVTLPLQLRCETSEQPDIASVFYGPLLLCPDLGGSGGDYTGNPWQQTLTKTPEDFPTMEVPMTRLDEGMERMGDDLRWKTSSNTSGGRLFLPFYDANHLRTSVYQRFTSREDSLRTCRYVADRINVGFDTGHSFSGRSTVGSIYNRHYLQVRPGNSISYTMRLSPEADMKHYVALQYDGWETDTVGCSEVYVDDVLIGRTGPCERAGQFTFPRQFFAVPLEMTRGKDAVRVKIKQKQRGMNFFGIELLTERYLQEMCPESYTRYGKAAEVIHLEAEEAQPHSDNRTFDGLSSAGAYVSRLTGYLQWNSLYIPTPGYYDLRIVYRGSTSLTYKVWMNDNVVAEPRLTVSDESWTETRVPLHLDEGFNTLRLAPRSVRSPLDIDYVELIPANGSGVNATLSERWGKESPDISFSATSASGIVTFEADEAGQIAIYDLAGCPQAYLDYPKQRSCDMASQPRGFYVARFFSKSDGRSCSLVISL